VKPFGGALTHDGAILRSRKMLVKAWETLLQVTTAEIIIKRLADDRPQISELIGVAPPGRPARIAQSDLKEEEDARKANRAAGRIPRPQN
jgi:hypothetical protein